MTRKSDIRISREQEGLYVSIQFSPERITLGDIKDMIAEVLLVSKASYEAARPHDVSTQKKDAPDEQPTVVEEAKPEPKKTHTHKTATKAKAVEDEPKDQVAKEPEEKPEPKKTHTRKTTAKTKATEKVVEEPEPPVVDEPERKPDDESEDDFDDTPVTKKELRDLAKEIASSGAKGKNAVKKVLGKYTRTGKLVGVQDEDVTSMYNDLCDVYDELFPEDEDAE